MNPQLYIIAGPNGAGKTTLAKTFLPVYTHCREFVNADDIAQKISPGNPEAAAIRAGREMLERIHKLAAQRVDFGIETTLSGKSYAHWFKELKIRGYETRLFFLWIPDVEMAIKRVAARVNLGGHHIPEPVIRRRYFAGIYNLFHYYRPLLNSWTLFDNSNPLLDIIATEETGKMTVFDEEKLSRFMKSATEPPSQHLQETTPFPAWVNATIAMRKAMLEVVEEYRRAGNSLIVWRDGKVYHQPPEEAKREIEEAINHEVWI